MEKNNLYKIEFLDVGQGDSTLILHVASNSAVLIDVGRFEPLIRLLFSDMSIESIFISHWHDDHIGGLPELINWLRDNDKHSILHLNRQNFNKKRLKRIVLSIHEAYKDKVLEIKSAHSDGNDNLIELINGLVSILWPPHVAFIEKPDDKNYDSQILKFQAGSFKLLLGGDATGDVWCKLPIEKIQANILKFPHHGGKLKKSNECWDSYQLLDAVDPEVTIVSFGNKNSYCHPASEFIEAADRFPEKQFYYTATEGSICFHIDAKSGSLRRFKDSY